MSDLLDQISKIFEEESFIDSEVSPLLDDFFKKLEQGEIRAASKKDGKWLVDSRVKQGILLAFRSGRNQKLSLGPFDFIDRHCLWPRNFEILDGVRIVLGGSSVRRGAFLGKGVTIMPPAFINVGAYVDDSSMIDSHALVGSCAQVGKRVHLSAGAQVGGVLEPVGARPVIIEDDVLIGGNAGLFEGVLIEKRAVIGAGVVLTKSTRIYDVVQERVIAANSHETLMVPESAVVISGSRKIENKFADQHSLSLYAPVIVKYRDTKTDAKTALEQALR